MKNSTRGKSLLAFLFCMVCVLSSIKPIEVRAEEYWPEGPEIEVPSAIVMEVNTGAILYEKNSKVKAYPASITKILTTLCALENSNMDEIVTFSHDAVYLNEANDTTHISRDVGEEMTMEQCLYAVMLESANECAYAVAEHVGEAKMGDYRTFIEMMNDRAKQLGCENTHFNNSNGLPDEDHWTCAYDMALISAEAYRNEDFRIITGTPTYTIPFTNKHTDAETYLSNHHKMLHYYKTDEYIYQYCTGGKTGYTEASGNTLVTYAEKDGMTLVCVVMNTKNPQHWLDTRILLDYCFDNFQVMNISENETSIAGDTARDVGILNENGPFVTLDTNAYVVLPKTASFEDAQFVLETGGEADTLAKFVYTYFGREVGHVEIVTTGVHVTEPEYMESVDDSESAENEVRVVQIQPKLIFTIVLAVVVLVGIIYLIKVFFDSFYVRKHDREIKRAQRNRFRHSRRSMGHSRRRKDRMFK